jgi:hypothetical protein
VQANKNYAALWDNLDPKENSHCWNPKIEIDKKRTDF